MLHPPSGARRRSPAALHHSLAVHACGAAAVALNTYCVHCSGAARKVCLASGLPCVLAGDDPGGVQLCSAYAPSGARESATECWASISYNGAAYAFKTFEGTATPLSPGTECAPTGEQRRPARRMLLWTLHRAGMHPGHVPATCTPAPGRPLQSLRKAAGRQPCARCDPSPCLPPTLSRSAHLLRHRHRHSE